MRDNNIVIKQVSKQTGILYFKNIVCKVWLGENGTTVDKIEGDLKTPLGKFDLGIVFGFHDRNEIKINDEIEYVRITDSMFWDCDANSETYNRLIYDKIRNMNGLNNFEHLVDYPIEYEYAIEIKTNPMQVSNKGSAIFLHCYNDKPTKGCIAVEKNNLISLIKEIDMRTGILVTK